MKKTILTSVFCAALLIGCEQSGVVYEYKVVALTGSRDRSYTEDVAPLLFADPTPVLNRMSSERWTLDNVYTEVSTVYPNLSVNKGIVGGIRTNTRTETINFIFKRRKYSQTTSEPETETISYDGSQSLKWIFSE